MVKNNQFAFSFDETKPIRFGVLPRYAKDESQMRWFEASAGVLLHVGKQFPKNSCDPLSSLCSSSQLAYLKVAAVSPCSS